MSDHMFAYYVQESYASAMSYSRLHSFINNGKCYFACLFLESVKRETMATKPAFLRILTRVDSLCANNA